MPPPPTLNISQQKILSTQAHRKLYNKPSHTYYTMVYLLHSYQHFPNLNCPIPLPYFSELLQNKLQASYFNCTLKYIWYVCIWYVSLIHKDSLFKNIYITTIYNHS